MVGIRVFSAAALAALLVCGGAGFALADPPPWAHPHLRASNPPPRAHAVIVGTVVGIDYGSAALMVATNRGIVPVAVTPSTNIFRGSSYASFADLGRGAHVEIDAADIAGRLIAQLIRIR